METNQVLRLILLVMALFLAWVVYMCVKYANPYKLIFLIAKKGGGKSTYFAYASQKHLNAKQPWKCYSTKPLAGCYLIDPNDLGKYRLPERSCVFIDEVGMVWDNRDWKSTPRHVRDFFKYQRHHRVKVYMASQDFDIDIKLRKLCDSMYMLFNFGGWLTYAKEIRRKLTIVKPSEEGESRIADELVMSPFFMAIFGARKILYCPRYFKYFDSFEAPDLPEKDWPIVPDYVPEPLKEKVPRVILQYRRRLSLWFWVKIKWKKLKWIL